jgi:hypothetical protein
MYWITEDAQVVCNHKLGKVQNRPSQDLVTIARRRVLVATDPEHCAIGGCPNLGPGIQPCLTTLQVQRGYSDWIRIDGHPLCLDTLAGFTNGTPPGAVLYVVDQPGQTWVCQP